MLYSLQCVLLLRFNFVIIKCSCVLLTITKTISETKYEELNVPESNQKQWQSKRKSECVNQNPAASSNQWQIPEINRKVDTEVTFVFPQVEHCHC